MTTNEANLFQLAGRAVHVTYATSGIDGKPHFTYQDAHQTLSFSGDQISVADTQLGKVVSVFLRRTIDSGSTTFSILLPRVGLGSDHSASIDTQGITTVHRFSIIPAFNRGQLDTYSYVRLHGTAQFVVF